MDAPNPEIQLISNVVVQDCEGNILLVKYDMEDERWWLPGEDLTPYQHPDDRAKEVLGALAGLQWDSLELAFIESFRGRRGWHVMFNYRAQGSGVSTGGSFAWFPADALPRTKHGQWEAEVVRRAIDGRSRFDRAPSEDS
jgi:hypothetical protein